MTYSEAIDYIMSRRKFQKSSGHERIERLLSLLGDPHKRLKFVHIVGTNGKGSVSTALSCITEKSGLKTGLFTSPYIICFNERIKVNGEFIPDGEVADITALIKEKTDLMEGEGLYPTVFEVTTALAMVYFAKVGCDIVILEAGIGGGKDSTNVIPDKLISVITSVSLDHTEMLGETVREITKEKCGIIKNGGRTVSYPFEAGDAGFTPQNTDAAEVITEVCRKKENKLYLPDANVLSVISEGIEGTEFTYGGLKIRVNLCGKHQIANMLTVIECAKALRDMGYGISDEDIRKGIDDFRIPGRTEVISRKPLVILDGGHNEGCMKALSDTIKNYLGDKKITLLCSFMKDKDYEKALSYVLPLCSKAVFTRTDTVRGEDENILCDIGRSYCECTAVSSVSEALKIAVPEDEDEVLIVCGSFYLVSEARKNARFAMRDSQCAMRNCGRN